MLPVSYESKTAVVCPLDWGLGHASRCIPVVFALQNAGYKVVVAADGLPLKFLREELGSKVEYHVLPGRTIRYQKSGSLLFALARQAFPFLKAVWDEHHAINRLIENTKATMVVSDNRYGLFTRRAKTVIISHQLFVMMPPAFKWAEPLVWRGLQFVLNRFDHCWVPDNEDFPNLSGKLSHRAGVPSNSRFVGPLSRFSLVDPAQFINPLPSDFPLQYYLVVLSGPEPQRSIFEEMLTQQFSALRLPVVMALGKPGGKVLSYSGNMIKVSHLNTSEMAFLLKNCQLVVCRSGYSSLMDLAVFGKKALLVPTPGQTEQEYLAEYLKESGQAFCVPQAELSLQLHLDEAMQYSGIRILKQEDRLQNAILGLTR